MKKYYSSGSGIVSEKVYNIDFSPVTGCEHHNIQGLNGAEILRFLASSSSPSHAKQSDSPASKKLPEATTTSSPVINGAVTSNKQAAPKGLPEASKSLQKTQETSQKANTAQKTFNPVNKTTTVTNNQAAPKVPVNQSKPTKKTPGEIKGLANALSKALEIESLEGLSGDGILNLILAKKAEVLLKAAGKAIQQQASKQQSPAKPLNANAKLPSPQINGSVAKPSSNSKLRDAQLFVKATVAEDIEAEKEEEKGDVVADDLPEKQKQKGGKKGKGKTKGKVHHKDGEVVGASAPELGVENRGRAMLEKMGWSKGEALGVGEDRSGPLVLLSRR